MTRGLSDREVVSTTKRSIAALAGVLLTLSIAAPGGAESGAPLGPGNDAVFKRLVALNAALKSYTATVVVAGELKSLLPLSYSTNGTVYYKQPDRQAVVFDSAPPFASSFKKLVIPAEPPATWQATNDVRVAGDAGGTTTFRLTPKKQGRVDHLDVKVDDATATPREYTWTYTDGGFATFDQTYQQIDGNYLVAKQSGSVQTPSLRVDATTSFSNYKLNVAVDDAVFADK